MSYLVLPYELGTQLKRSGLLETFCQINNDTIEEEDDDHDENEDPIEKKRLQ